jgi:hypothetical protein
MSINALAEAEVKRDAEKSPQAANAAAAGGGAGGPGPVNNALSMLVKYIPTETITLYVAAISAAAALKGFWPRLDETFIYWLFGLLTPVLFAFILLGKRRAAHLSPLVSLKDWPWWKNVAATVAFLVWALAVPGNPYVKGDTSGAVAGFFAIFISTILSVLEPLFDQPSDA